MSQQDYDVIIIGAGIAGLVTANRAAQLGKHVAVLEKSTEEKYICNSRYAYGTFHINFTGLDAPEDTLLRQDRRRDRRLRAEGPGARRRQGRPPADAMAEERGHRPRQPRRLRHQRAVAAVAKRLRPDLARTTAPTSRCSGSRRTFSKRQGRILRGTRAQALKLVPGGIEIEVEQTDGAKRFSAPCVVIADGGFQANLDMLRMSGISPAPEKLLARNGGTAVGDGLRMAQALGRGGERRHEQFLRPSAQPRRHAKHQALAAAGHRRSRRRPASSSTPTAAASPTRRSAASGSPTPSPACPTRSAPRSSSTRRSGTARPAAITCSRPIRWWSRPAARCIAPTRSPSSPKRSACRRSG